MQLKRDIFHFLLRVGKKQSRNITNAMLNLTGKALSETRHRYIQIMRVKSRMFAKIFHKVIGSNPEGVTNDAIKLAGIDCLKIYPENPGKRVIFYLHGGGFVIGLADSLHHHGYLPHLAAATNTVIYELDYRVAPEHPFPIPVEDVFQGYLGLLELGIDPRNIIVMGDSAGGTLTLALLLKLRDLGLPMPAGSITMSPATAPVHSVESYHARVDVDPMFTQEVLSHIYTPAYSVPEHHDSPYLHPIFGDYHGMPPMLIFVGGCELLYDHSVLVADKAKRAGVDVTLDVHEEMIHAYPVLYDLYDEAKDAMTKVVAFVNRVAA